MRYFDGWRGLVRFFWFRQRNRRLAPPAAICATASTMAINISRSARLMFWLMISVGFSILVGAICFVLFAAELSWSRLLTFVVLGVFPSIVACGSAWVMYWLLQAGSIAYDPIAIRAERTFCALASATMFSLGLSARALLIAVVTGKWTAHWIAARSTEAWMIVQKTFPFFRYIWSCVVVSIHAVVRYTGYDLSTS